MQMRDTPDRRFPLGPVTLGLVLVVGGLVWFLDAVDIVDLRWRLVVPAILAGIGVALLVTVRREPPGWLVAAGIVLSVLVVSQIATPALTIAPTVGDRVETPASVEELEPSYGLSVGSLEIDLRDTDLDSNGGEPVRIEASVGLGELVVRLPPGTSAEVEARSLAGEIVIEDVERSGINIRADEALGSTPPALVLDLSVGLGAVEVTR